MGKSKKTARNDRQKVIDDIRRQQKKADARQGRIIVTVSATIAALIVGSAIWFGTPLDSWLRTQAITASSLAEIGAGPDVCGEVTTEQQEGNQHVDQGVQVQYSSAPPATGDHWNVRNLAPVPITQRFYSEGNRPELEQLVHNSEHGYTILWYDESVSGGEVAEIRKMADFLDDNDTNFRFKFKAVPWTAADAQEVEDQLALAVDSAQAQVDAAQASVEGAETKKDRRAARAQLKTAEQALESAQETAEAGGEFPEGMHIALTHWTADGQGVRQYCSEPSGEALEEFMFDYPYSDSPEPNAM